MKRKSIPSILAAAIVAAALTSSTQSQAAQASREEHKEIAASSGGTLTFKTMVGAVEIKTHNDDKVIYDAELKAGGWFSSGSAVMDQVEFDYENSGGNVKITMKWKNDKQPRNSNLNARHTLLIPSRYNIDVRTAGGSIKGADINGQVAARTSGGSIRFGRVTGDLKAHTSGGSITLEDVKGDADVQTSGGSIKVDDVDGNLMARTSGGSIRVGTVSGELKGKTSGGSISAEIASQIDEPLELTTSGGGIDLRVPGNLKADLNASTSGGKVKCDLPLEGTIKKTSINAKINGGGPRVTLHTSGGSINVAKR